MVVPAGNSLSSKNPSWMKILSASFWAPAIWRQAPSPQSRPINDRRPPTVLRVLKISLAKASLSFI